MWSVRMDANEARRRAWQAREASARRLSEAIWAEAERIVDERRKWWRRPLFAKRLTVDEVDDLLTTMVCDPDKRARDMAARDLGLSYATSWRRHADLSDLAAVVRRFNRMLSAINADGVTGVTLTGEDMEMILLASGEA